MNFTRIIYFLEAAKHGNFTAAAAKLYTSQPNLSKQIALLEEELGFALFSRINRAVRLTPAGDYLYKCWQHIPGELEEDIGKAKQIANSSEGFITVGVIENILLSTAFSKLNEKIEMSDIRFQFEHNTFDGLRKGLEEFKYNLILSLSFDLEGMDGIFKKTIQRGKIGAIFISYSNPLSQKEDLTLKDLKDEQFIVISPSISKGGNELLLNQCRKAGFEPKIARMASSLEALLLSVETGQGVTILDRTTRLEYSDAVRIVPMRESETIDVVAAWAQSEQNPSIPMLVDALSE